MLKGAFSLALLVLPTCVSGQGFSRVSMPIAIDIEDQSVRCPIYFKLELKEIGAPIDKFAGGKLSDSEAMFVAAVQAVRKNDAVKFGTVWAAPNEMKTTTESNIALKDNTPSGWLQVIRSNFNFDTLNVVAEAEIGSEPMFVWEVTSKDGNDRRAFYVGTDKKGNRKLSIVSSATPVQNLILMSFVAAQKDQAAYKPVANVNTRYQYPIPVEGPGGSGPHPVFFQFDGMPMDFPLANEKVKPPMPVLEFLRQTAQTYAAGQYDAFANNFTEKSGLKVKQWIAAMQNQRARQRLATPAKQDKSELMPVSAGNVKFVMKAEPLYIVFQAPTIGTGWTPAQLTYQYVLLQGGSYKIAEFGYSNFLDDLLQDQKLFDKRILKPAQPKAAPPKAHAAPTAKQSVTKH